ncbi:UNVERIFIED_CONTAM: hypothetical protein FKN15_031157 [Acipenser sinensis]
MNTRCPPKHVPSAARFFTLCRLTMQPPQSYSVGGQHSSGQLTGKPAGTWPDYRGRWFAVLIYSRQLDVIVAIPLTERFLPTVPWSKVEEYKKADRFFWKVNPDDSEVAGYVCQVGGFYQSESINRLTPGVKDKRKSAEQLNIQADQGGPGEPDKGTAEKTKRKKEVVNYRARHVTTTESVLVKDAATAGIPERARSVGNPGDKNLTIKTIEGVPMVSFAQPTSHPVQAKAEKFNLLQRDNRRLPVVTDPCEFNRHFILNITAEKVESTTATIQWKVLDHQGPKHSQIHFRILFDRFGQPVRFHRFIYIRDQSNSVTLQELKEDTTYMVCIKNSS